MDVQNSIAGIRTIQGALQVITMLQMTAHLFPQQADVKDGDIFDAIVVGAGSAGSVVANRLTENPNVNVLLIEAGGDPPLESVLPGLMGFLPDTPVDWNYTTTSSRSTQCHMNNVYKATRGKMLGGSSSINYMAYLRGDPEDFNSWARITGDESWSYKNVLPYFIKSENLEDDEILNSPTRYFHGTNGYLGVTRPTNEETIPYLQSFREVGHKIRLDMNTDNILGYGEHTFTKLNGVRQSTAQSFLSPITGRPNLYVLKRALATKILFDKFKNAIGVQLIDENNKNMKVMAKTEVIVSAGAINSPQLLMLSGIGPRQHLRNHKIPLLADLPVGQNLQDHICVMLIHSLGETKKSSRPPNPHELPVPMMNGFVTVDNTTYPNYQTLHLILTADEAMQFCSSSFAYDYNMCQQIYEQTEGKEVLFTLVVDLEGKSRGQVSLKSRDPEMSAVIDLRAYSKVIDLDNTVRYIKDFLKIENSSYFRINNAKLFKPDCVKGQWTGSKDNLTKLSLCLSTSIFHYSGTCAMGSVLDSRLRVFGVNRLRVVDASVMPKLVRANPNPAIIMIAEKAADMIKQDNGL